MGMRFKVLVLVPAIGLALITIVAVGFAGGNSLFAVAIAAALASCCLQLGYVFGAFTRYGLASDRFAKPPVQPYRRAGR